MCTLPTVIRNANECGKHDRKTGVDGDVITSKVILVTSFVCVSRPCSGETELVMF